MTDRDVISRVGEDLERVVLELAPRRTGYRTPYAVSVKGIDAVRLMCLVRSELGRARQGQIDRALVASRPIETRAAPVTHECTAADRLSWLAGLLEGEGTFTTTRAGNHLYPVIALKMVSKDVVERAAQMLETTNVHSERPRDPSWSVTQRLAVSGAAAAVWMQRLRPLMGERRRAAIDAALDGYYPMRLTDVPVTCCVAGCTAPPRGRGLCHKHYMSWLRDRARSATPRVRPLRSN